MAQIFPEWTNKIPSYLAVTAVLLLTFTVAAVWYYFSPQYTDTGYRPKQPVAYSHKFHAGDLGLDCRYCHSTVEFSPAANIPPTQTCINCHRIILPRGARLKKVRSSWETGNPIEWIRVHNLPDYVYFNHSIHLYAGIGCSSCHGDVTQKEVIEQTEPLSMGWCLKCHRNPEMHIRAASEITNMKWTPLPGQKEFADIIIKEKNISPPEDCSGCHR